MNTLSVWRGTSQAPRFPVLEGEVQADVVVVGGGITGVTAALLLADAGKRVVLLEGRRVGQGATGNSTGNLYAVLASRLYTVGDKWDAAVMRAVARSRTEAVGFIEHTVRRFGLDCAFVRCPLRLYAVSPDRQESVEREYEAAIAAGLPARMETSPPLPVEAGRTLVVDGQAQFHPLAYVRGLALKAPAICHIYEDSPAVEIDTDAHRVRTPRGQVTATDIVVATHTPKGFNLVQAEMVPQREYGIGVQLANGACPPGIHWGTGEDRHSVRTLEVGGKRWLIAVGAEHKTGEDVDTVAHLQRLEDFARRHFDVASVDFRWSAQGYRPADALPYIGRGPGSDAYIATGFGTDGLTYGTLAAGIIRDAILGQENPWAGLYKSTRFAPVKAAKGVLEENLNVAKALIKDYLTPAQVAQLAVVAPGTGRIAEVDGDKVAAYRDASGALSVLSPVCTHLKCMVHWNAAEGSWDCPCHGSRFDTEGCVIEGPAIAPLKRKSLAPDT